MQGHHDLHVADAVPSPVADAISRSVKLLTLSLLSSLNAVSRSGLLRSLLRALYTMPGETHREDEAKPDTKYANLTHYWKKWR